MTALLVVVLSTITVGTISYFMNRETSIRLNSEKALGVARTIAAAVDPVGYREVLETGEKNDYWYTLEAYLGEVLMKNGLVYLYVLYDYDAQNVYYYAEGMADGDTAVQMDLHEQEDINNFDEHVKDVFRGYEVVSDEIYSTAEWGKMVSGMAPVFDENGGVIGIVGADIAVNEVLASADQFGFMILLMVIGISIVMGLLMALFLRRSLGEPIAELTAVAQRIACGETDLEIRTKSRDEIGMLADSFRAMAETVKDQARTLEAIAEGDLSVSIQPRSDKDVMNHAFADTIARLDTMISQINALTSRIATESGEIAASAQSLATGAANQSAATEELSATVTEISAQTKQNASLAEAAARLASELRQEVTVGFDKLETLIDAVKDIRHSSLAIGSVLKVIEDIALQTNILALNASVEASHAGKYGDGFAVVAREVQDLSRKTSTNAKQTAELIEDTLRKTKQGVLLAEAVHGTMETVVRSTAESNRIAEEIAMSSREQMTAIEQVNQGIHQVAMVVHENRNVAEKNAAVSREMNGEIESLKGLVARFKTRK